ncbi:hypothetical protein GCM10008018_24710 [Paenibacillus marchantiophytorum]|uniref:Uncharacterized protein n=1 Tax=Paenibacillus marchantiophytorum TaxID=1619310 RepID=A0ABQ1EM49_9BACL|nr:hypothetical protein GCM10008018_24710 [Paenibacillus marchantiophytorum]
MARNAEKQRYSSGRAESGRAELGWARPSTAKPPHNQTDTLTNCMMLISKKLATLKN